VELVAHRLDLVAQAQDDGRTGEVDVELVDQLMGDANALAGLGRVGTASRVRDGGDDALLFEQGVGLPRVAPA
jgi:hypothetical protein